MLDDWDRAEIFERRSIKGESRYEKIKKYTGSYGSFKFNPWKYDDFLCGLAVGRERVLVAE